MVPARANAAAGAAAAFAGVSIPAGLAVAAGVVGLGVMAGVTTDALDGVVDGCVNSVPVGQYILDGTIDAVKYTDPSGNEKWLLPLGFLETLRNLLFADGVVYNITGDYSLDFTRDGTAYSVTSSYPFEVVHLYFTYGSKSSLVQTITLCGGRHNSAKVNGSSISSSKWSIKNGFQYVYTMTTSSGSSLPDGLFDVSGIESVYLGHFPDVSSGQAFRDSWVFSVSDVGCSDSDLTLGNVGLSSNSLSEVHPSWVSGAITVPGSLTPSGNDEKYIPVGLPADYSAALNSTQEKVQSGESDYVVTIIPGGVPDSSEPTTPDSGDDVVVPPDSSLLEGLFGGLESKLDDIHVTFQEIPGLLRELFADIKTSIIELPSKFAEWFENIQTALQELIAGQITIGQLLGEFLSPLIEAFRTLLQSLFVPSSTFVSNKVDSLVAKYPHFNVFIGLGTQLKTFFLGLGSKPPIIYIDLGAATGSYVFGDRQPFIDLTWYAEYKPVMDGILGAFIWLWLAWRIFLMLPGIINGSSGAAGSLVRYSERSMKSQDGGADR